MLATTLLSLMDVCCCEGALFGIEIGTYILALDYIFRFLLALEFCNFALFFISMSVNFIIIIKHNAILISFIVSFSPILFSSLHGTGPMKTSSSMILCLEDRLLSTANSIAISRILSDLFNRSLSQPS